VSQDNTEIVQAMYDAYNSGDMDATLSFYSHDTVVLPDASVFPEARALHGLEEFRAWLEQIGAAWTNPQWKTIQLFALTDGRVICRGDWGGEGVASSIKLASGITGIITIRDDQISRIEYFFDHDKALKAVGLSE
jgi:ketosteroid isomerase-like protein